MKAMPIPQTAQTPLSRLNRRKLPLRRTAFPPRNPFSLRARFPPRNPFHRRARFPPRSPFPPRARFRPQKPSPLRAFSRPEKAPPQRIPPLPRMTAERRTFLRPLPSSKRAGRTGLTLCRPQSRAARLPARTAALPPQGRSSARKSRSCRGVSGSSPTTASSSTDTIIITTSFLWKKMVMCGSASPAYTMSAKRGRQTCSAFLSLPAPTLRCSDSLRMSGTTEQISAIGAAISIPTDRLDDPVHLLVQPLSVAVRHAAHIVCHEEQAEIQFFRLALPLRMEPVCILVIIRDQGNDPAVYGVLVLLRVVVQHGAHQPVHKEIQDR